MSRYLDHYPHCEGCPVEKYCGTMCMSTRLCNSYPDKEEIKEEQNGHK